MSRTLEEHAARVWPILVSAALNRQTLTYELLNERIKYMTPGLGEVLIHLMRYCEDRQLPPLTVLVVQKHSGKPGNGLTASADPDADRERVYQFPWFDLPAPTSEQLRPYGSKARAAGSP